MHVFLGITGASGAPYAARLLEALAAADCEIGVCASSAGIEVLGTELFGDPDLPRDETLARLLEPAKGAARIYDPKTGKWADTGSLAGRRSSSLWMRHITRSSRARGTSGRSVRTVFLEVEENN